MSIKIVSSPEASPAVEQPTKKKLNWRRWLSVAGVTALFLGVSAVLSWLQMPSSEEQKNYSFPSLPHLKTAEAGAFAAFDAAPVKVTPAVPAYDFAAAVDATVAENLHSLPDAAWNQMRHDGFVVVPAFHQEFFPLYEQNRYQKIPNFITVDAVLHNFHLAFSRTLQSLEERTFRPELQKLLTQLATDAAADQQALVGTSWEHAAKRNLAFVTTAAKLLDDKTTVPPEVALLVEAELQLINKAGGLTLSPLMNDGLDTVADPSEMYIEDYSQYIPRGHYDRNELLKTYFRSMMWLGRITFRFNNPDEARSAVLFAVALNRPANRLAWEKIYEPTGFLVGKSDDIDYWRMIKPLEAAYAGTIPPSVTALVDDQKAFDGLLFALHQLPPPEINSQVIFNEEITPDREKVIKGFRLMGQRAVPDAAIFQKLIYRDVQANPAGQNRMLPKALDVAAVMGSSEAFDLLVESGETAYAGYTENFTKMQSRLGGLNHNLWTQNSYWAWLYAIKPLLGAKTEGYPSFMLNESWTRKQLETWLGSWTELKHDTILYAKQVYAELGGGPGDEIKRDDRGYVEPQPESYARLAALTRMLRDGLAARSLLGNDDRNNLETLALLADRLKDISEQELVGATLSDDDYEFIRSFGGQLEHFWLMVNESEIQKAEMSWRNYLDQNPAPLVADVATDPNGVVLEEGTGYVSEIYAVVPVAGVPKVVKGGAFAHYEFTWPLTDRLTDAKWRDLLNTQPPPRESWKEAYTVTR